LFVPLFVRAGAHTHGDTGLEELDEERVVGHEHVISIAHRVAGCDGVDVTPTHTLSTRRGHAVDPAARREGDRGARRLISAAGSQTTLALRRHTMPQWKSRSPRQERSRQTVEAIRQAAFQILERDGVRGLTT